MCIFGFQISFYFNLILSNFNWQNKIFIKESPVNIELSYNMAPKSVSKKKQIKNKKSTKAISKKNGTMSDSIDDSDDGSLDAIEFNSE